MIKKIFISLLAFLMLVSFPSCQSEAEPKGEFYSFVDSSGREVRLEEKPKRVAVLFSSYTEMWISAGGEVAVSIGESVERGFVDGVILVDTGAGKRIDLEALVASNPDFVIASADIEKQREACEFMSDLGVPSALFKVESFEDYKTAMGHFCAITENEKAYGDCVTAVGEKIAETISKYSGAEQKRILFIRAATSAKSTKAKRGEDNFAAAMLEELGCFNIADSAPLLLDGISDEAVLRENPDFIFFTSMGDEEKVREFVGEMLKSPVWQSLDAVKNENYAFLPKEMFGYKPNHRWGEAYKYLAELLYGE